MNRKNYYKAGFIKSPHGLKGEVTISLDQNAPSDWADIKMLLVEINNHLLPYFVETISMRGVKAFLKLDEVNTPEAASALKGCSIFLEKDTRPKLEKGDFYNEEVIGFEVFDEDQGPLGIVVDVEQAGPNRFLILKFLQKEIMIPVNGPFIKSINKSKKKISVSLPDGFLDI